MSSTGARCAHLIFADPGKRRDLEAILHPLIRADMERRAAEAVGPYLVLAIPLLVESGCPRPRGPDPGRRRG